MYEIIETRNYLKIVDELKVHPLVAKAIEAHNLKKITNFSLKDFSDYQNINKVVELIKDIIKNNKKTIIYGDYDCDGICATSILVKTFEKLNYDVSFYIPNRYEDGYGLNKEKVKQFAEEGYEFLIAVDCGVKDFEALDLAYELGMKVIILDHHEIGEKLPKCEYLLHPTYSEFSEYNMCAASISFYLSWALLGEVDEYLLTLAGLATLGDVMPLVEENKLLVHLSLQLINKHKYTPLYLLGDSSKKIDEKTYGFYIVPKINAVGRIKQGNEENSLVDLLISEDKEEIIKLVNFVTEANNERKSLSRQYFESLPSDLKDKKVIVYMSDHILEGLSGLVAGRLSNEYLVPSIVLTQSKDPNIYKGSGRSNSNVSLISLLDASKDYLEAYGGHDGAAGLSIKKDNIEAFKQSLEKEIAKLDIKPELLRVIETNVQEINYETYLQLLQYAPFGEGNKEPLFLFKNISKQAARTSRDGKHLLFNFYPNLSMVSFNSGSLLNDANEFDLIFTLEENSFYENSVSGKIIKIIPK